MKAHELARFLMIVPEAEVEFAGIFVGQPNVALGDEDISMNAEAKVYTISYPVASRRAGESRLITSKTKNEE